LLIGKVDAGGLESCVAAGTLNYFRRCSNFRNYDQKNNLKIYAYNFIFAQPILSLPKRLFLTIKGTFRLSHQYINTYYNSYRLHVSAFIAIFRPTL